MKAYFEVIEETTPGDASTRVGREKDEVSTGSRSDFLDGDGVPLAQYRDKTAMESKSTTYDAAYRGKKVLERIHFCDHDDAIQVACKVLTIRDWTTPA